MIWTRSRVSLVRSLALAAACLALAPAGAQALPSSTPSSSAFATNGNVDAIAHHGGTTYIGGSFTELRAITGSHVRLDPATGKRSAPSPIVPSGSVEASIPDGAGGVYIGGGFNIVGNQNHFRVAHILADGTVDPNFNTPVFSGGARVLALALGADGALYVGGDFTSIGGTTRNNIAKLSATSGNLFTTWDPDMGNDPAHTVSALAVSGSELFVGGLFKNIGGQPRDAIAKLSTASGNAFSGWNPDPVETDSFANPQIRSLVVSGGNLYVGGLFSEIGTLPRNNVAKLSTASGNAFSAWDPDARQGISPGTAAVDAIALSDDATQVYVGGQFTTIKEAPGQHVERNRIAKLSAASGNAFSGFNPNADAAVDSLALSGDQVYASGLFENIGGLERHAVAKLSGTSGNAFSLFEVNPRQGTGVDGQIFTLAFSGGRVYAGGTLDSVNNVARRRLAALDSNGIPTSFNPGGVGAADQVRALDLNEDGTQLFVGGKFDSIADIPRKKIAKVSTVNGSVLDSFDAGEVEGSSPENTVVDEIEFSNGNVFVSGDIRRIGGREPGALAKLSGASGNAFSGFNPDPTGFVGDIKASGDGAHLFVGGGFTDIGGQEHDNLAKLDTLSGAADPAWSPSPSDTVGALEVDGGALYAGGNFGSIGGFTRHHLAKVSTTSGNVFSTWDPDADGPVSDLALSGSTLYAGGVFSAVGGQFHNRLAAIYVPSGNPFSGFQGASDDEVRSLAASPVGLHVGQIGGAGDLDTGYLQFDEP